MNKIRYVAVGCLISMLAFTSCEMKDEIWGKDGGKTAGKVELDLASVYNGKTLSRAGTTVDNGITSGGGFSASDIDVENYTLVIVNKETQETVKEGLISEMQNTDGKLSIALPAGTYVATAYNYDGADVKVSTRPYFMGQTEFTVQTDVTNKVDVNCKLACVEIGMELTDAFSSTFKDDYSIVVSNGADAAQTISRREIGTKYYFQVPKDKQSFDISVKANTVSTGSFINVTYVVTKPENAEGQTDIEGGDSFDINLTPEGATESHVTIGISVDLTFTEKGETIEVPAENIIFDDNGQGEGGDNGSDSGGDSQQPQTDITFEGLPATYVCKHGDESISGLKDVKITAPNGIKHLNVTISGAIAELAGMMGLTSFDICNMDEVLQNTVVNQLELVTTDDYEKLHSGTCTDYTFKLGSLLVLVPSAVESGDSVFSLSVSDGKNTKGGDITVTVNPE